MSRPASIPPSSRSWRDIRQGVSTRAMSQAGRRRLMVASVKFALLCGVIFAGAWAVFEVYATWESNPARLKDPVKAVPLKQVVFGTDGVLDRAWLDQALALPRNASLMNLDLAALERRVLASGQVRSVVLRRRFVDNTLVVTMQERTPVARVMVQVGAGTPGLRLVAADGVVYAGLGYERAVLEPLPWLAGLQLRRAAAGGFEPIAGMETVAALLTAAESLVPALRADWQVVSLARLASDQEIEVRSREIPQIIFDARGYFPRQLAKLDYVVDSLRTHGAPPMARVNLALGSQVPVELQETAPLQPPRSALPRPASQPKSRRDF